MKDIPAWGQRRKHSRLHSLTVHRPCWIQRYWFSKSYRLLIRPLQGRRPGSSGIESVEIMSVRLWEEGSRTHCAVCYCSLDHLPCLGIDSELTWAKNKAIMNNSLGEVSTRCWSVWGGNGLARRHVEKCERWTRWNSWLLPLTAMKTLQDWNNKFEDWTKLPVFGPYIGAPDCGSGMPMLLWSSVIRTLSGSSRLFSTFTCVSYDVYTSFVLQAREDWSISSIPLPLIVVEIFALIEVAYLGNYVPGMLPYSI